jgi:hypothetical protein
METGAPTLHHRHAEALVATHHFTEAAAKLSSQTTDVPAAFTT